MQRFGDTIIWWTDEEETRQKKAIKQQCNEIYSNYCDVQEYIDDAKAKLRTFENSGFSSLKSYGPHESSLYAAYYPYREKTIRDTKTLIEDLRANIRKLEGTLGSFETAWNAKYRELEWVKSK
ncbi:hypothetical protein EDD63_16214 [Breznakia blatticola]|uniref:DUF5082 domain-containing protein n=1 Tax=Breznakia blatticola TaxID=1754012 RepID=A0A4R7Z8E4_9FIRM|nr:hypothetical protein [Breznakia blatticola]TDW09201.1 hypothetical protein EDD63_16214 [Breznakia blatticola]